MQDKPLALEVDNLCCRHDRQEVLHDVSLHVTQGSVCGLLGPNGSGKTTLFRCLLNFHRIHAGKVRICGKSTANLSPADMARLVSYVPQEHHAAFPFSVREMVSMGRNPQLSWTLRFRKEHERATDRALELLGMGRLAAKPFTTLSGGQKQMALIARAVAQEAPLMLLDEPTSALDFQNQIEVWLVLRNLARLGFTIMVCCHDPNHILWFCDQTALLKDGRILASGKSAEVVTEEALNCLYGPVCALEQLPDGMHVAHPLRKRIGL